MCWNWIRKTFFPSGWRQPFFQFEVDTPLKDLEKRLRESGFVGSPFSYWDAGEELNLRKIYPGVDLSAPARQLHVRAFKKERNKDVYEIFAHDEFMPESNPSAHYYGESFKDLSDEQKELLKKILLVI